MKVFFFQAEDGIRDGRVTGVQTCALPISKSESCLQAQNSCPSADLAQAGGQEFCAWRQLSDFAVEDIDRRLRRLSWDKFRSEERRVGKECRTRWEPYQYKRK